MQERRREYIIMVSNGKREKFVEIAEARTNKIIDMIHLLGNCSNRNNYEYTDADVNQIFAALENELKECRKRFQPEKTVNRKFKLKG